MAAGADQRAKPLYEFGPFRVDPEKELLLRGDETVPLTPKTFQILLVLVRHKKEIVTKDELMKEVWPDTFVEEANLSRNIFLLRKALGESPQDHQYIVTVPGRGYRFAEDVQLIPERELDIVAASHSTMQVQVKESRPWAWVTVAAVLLLAVAAGAFKLFFHRSPVLTEKDTVVLADFVNSTGDPVFDGTLRQGLAVDLEQSPFLSLISDQRVEQTLRLMDQSPDARITPPIARDLCRRTQSAAYLTGSIANLGSQYVLGLKAVGCATGDVVAEEQQTAAGKEKVLAALDQAASRLREKMGESLSTVQKFDTPLEQATTPSLEALQAYSLAMKQFHLMNFPPAATLFQRAIGLDPNFAMAYARLASLNRNNKQSEAMLENSAKAYALRERVTDRERLYIESTYHMVRSETVEASRVYELWESTYPRDPTPNGGLAVIDGDNGQFDNMLEEARRAYQKESSVLTSWNLIEALTDLDHLDEADKALAESKARFPGQEEWARWDYALAFLRGDQPRMRRMVDAAPTGSTLQRTMWSFHWRTELYFGRQEEAAEYRRRAMNLSRQLGVDDRASLYAAMAALQEADYGEVAQAKRAAAEVPSQVQGKDPLRRLALAYARLGDAKNADRVALQLARLYPTDTLLKNRDLPLVRAALALQQNNPSLAIELLESAIPTELGNPDVAYTRGQGYLLLHRATEAAAEFQKVIRCHGFLLNDAPGALPYLGLARAYDMQGDAAKARTAYQDFLTLWKDADPDIPILKQAKAEYAKLR